MKSMIITYDLCSPNRDYSELYKKLQSYLGWAKITESTWLLKTNSSCIEVRDDISSVMDNNDRLFVTESTGAGAWRNVICKSNYLKENL